MIELLRKPTSHLIRVKACSHAVVRQVLVYKLVDSMLVWKLTLTLPAMLCYLAEKSGYVSTVIQQSGPQEYLSTFQ